MRILLLNGPNLNLLGTREPEIYGSTSLPEVEQMCRAWAEDLGHQLEAYQSNHEGALIDALHGARGVFDGVILNGGALTHTSYALRDAIEAIETPTVEIHISNIHAREEFRRLSVTAPACVHQIYGRGVDGYHAAIKHLHFRAMRPPITVHDGDEDRAADLRLPDGDGPFPVVGLYHGGFWREHYTRDSLDGLAVDLTIRGYATWNVEYRRIPPIGGWRTTIGDCVDALEALSTLAETHSLNLDAVTLVGHSAGAHLAFFAAKRASIKPARVALLGGVLDLELLPADHDALPNFLGEELESHRDEINPTSQVPLDTPSLVVHGALDDNVEPAHAERFVAAATRAGDTSELIMLAESDHFDIIDPASSAWAQIAARLSPDP